MNIQNIALLAEQLEGLGFRNASYSLLKRICFKPHAFSLLQKIKKDKDELSIQLFFEKDIKENTYFLMSYDAVLQKEMSLSDTTINGINTASLDKQMAGIDWQKAFELDENKPWNVNDKASWEKEQKIEVIMENLLALEVAEEGKAISVSLKLKYWAGVPYQELIGNISPLKNKLEVSQRFYFFEGQTGISLDEAYRFLQNRWMEKQMQAKRKQADDVNGEKNEGPKQISSGSGLLHKKTFKQI